MASDPVRCGEASSDEAGGDALLRFKISSMSGRTVEIECSALDETAQLFRSAAESLGFPWLGWGAYSLLVKHKLITARQKILDCPDLLSAEVVEAILVRRAGIELKVVYPSFMLTGSPSACTSYFTAATICGLRQDMQASLGMDFSTCQALIAGLDLAIDEEADLQNVLVHAPFEHRINPQPVTKISFVGHVKADLRPAPCIRWILRELPSGEKYYDADFFIGAREKSAERFGGDFSGANPPSQDSGSSPFLPDKNKGKGKGPPLPDKNKGKGKGTGAKGERSEKPRDASPLVLFPGKNVLTRLSANEGQRDAREGIVVGWCRSEDAWVVRMSSGMDWLLKTGHLMARNAKGVWCMASTSAEEKFVLSGFNSTASSVIRVSEEEACQARVMQAIVDGQERYRRTVEWAEQCALDRESRMGSLLIEGNLGEVCVGSLCSKAGSRPADAKWDPRVILTFRPCKVGRVVISPAMRDLFETRVVA